MNADKTAKQTTAENGEVEEQQTIAAPKQPIPWKTIFYTGAFLGVIASLVSLYRPDYTQLAASFAMLFAIYYIQPKVKTRRYLAGVLSSTIAGLISWLGILIFHPSFLIYDHTAPVLPQALRTFGVTFLPMWAMVSFALSWINLWVVQRAEKRREQLEQEKRAKKAATKKPGTSSFKRKKKKKKKKY